MSSQQSIVTDTSSAQGRYGICAICGNRSQNKRHLAREMMCGIRAKFTYLECGACGCLQLLDPPADMSAYYPRQYYSYQRQQQPIGSWNSVRRHLRKSRNRSYFGISSLIRPFLGIPPSYAALYAFSKIKAPKMAAILDVGCGAGLLLQDLLDVGFRNISGIDPFVAEDIDYRNGLQIRKCYLADMSGTTWDVIMFHHSFEHVADPRNALSVVARLLRKGGTCLIRIPVLAWAWEHYGINWTQVDAPRHFFLHTEKSLQLLAEDVGLTLTSVDYDSTEDQFIGSELCTRDVPRTSITPQTISKFFSKRDLRMFRKRARTLNRQRLGDQASFYLVRN